MGTKLTQEEREELRARKEAKRGGYEYRSNSKEGADFSRRLEEGFEIIGEENE